MSTLRCPDCGVEYATTSSVSICPTCLKSLVKKDGTRGGARQAQAPPPAPAVGPPRPGAYGARPSSRPQPRPDRSLRTGVTVVAIAVAAAVLFAMVAIMVPGVRSLLFGPGRTVDTRPPRAAVDPPRAHDMPSFAGSRGSPYGAPSTASRPRPMAPRPAPRPQSGVPEPGDVAPEISAQDWLNVDRPQSLSGARGHVVLLEFWATWCGPCRRSIPHLNELHRKYERDGLRVMSMTRESRQKVEQFMQTTPMSYPVGLGSSSSSTYGVRGIPHAYVIGKDGKVLWHGHPASDQMEREIRAAL